MAIKTIVLKDRNTGDTLFPATDRSMVNGLESNVPVTTIPVGGFLPNVVYDLGTLTTDTVFSLASLVSGIVNCYYWTFSIGSTVPTITMPQTGISAWVEGSEPTIEANTYYEIFVRNGVATYIKA